MRKFLLALFFIFILSSRSWAAAPACGSETSSVTEADPQTVVFTPDAGSNRAVIVQIAIRDNTTTVSGVTSSAGGTWTQYGTGAFNATPNPDVRSYVFWSTDFADGSQTLSVDYNSAATGQSTVVVYTCTGVDQTSPFRGAAATNTGGGTPVTVTVTSATGDLVVDAVSYDDLPTDLTAGAGQTQKYNISNGGGNHATAASTEAGAASVDMTWTVGGSLGQWATVAGSLQPPTTTRRAVSPIIFQ